MISKIQILQNHYNSQKFKSFKKLKKKIKIMQKFLNCCKYYLLSFGYKNVRSVR